jgi:hypothetical protein
LCQFEQLKVNIPFISVRFWCGRGAGQHKKAELRGSLETCRSALSFPH